MKHFQNFNRKQLNPTELSQIESDIEIRLQRETNKKLEEQLVEFCSNTNDETLMKHFEEISSQLGRKISLSKSTRAFKNDDANIKEKSDSRNEFSPPVINISIDGISRNSSSQSTRSNLK